MATDTVKTTYLSQGIDKNANKTKGEIQGSDQAPVKRQLRKQGVAPNKIKGKLKDLFEPRRKKIKPEAIAVFSRRLITSMKSGIQFVQSFEIVGETLENLPMRELFGQIFDDAGAGNTFTEYIRKHPRYFQL